MKPSSVTANAQRNLAISLSLGLSLGLGVIGVNAHSSSEASSSIKQTTVAMPTPTQTDDGRSLHHSSTSNHTVIATPPDSFITYDEASPQPPQPDSSTLGTSTASESKQVPAKRLNHEEAPIALFSKQVTPSMPGLLPMDASNTANASIEQTLAQVIPDISSCPAVQAAGTNTQTHATMDAHRYVYHPVDLNGDRQDEIIVQVLGPMTCGTGGCTTLILEESADSPTTDYKVITQMSVANFPVIVSDRTSAGWNDLLVMVSGGGTQPGYRHLKFDGQSYPTNPSMATAFPTEGEQPNGQVLQVTEASSAIAPIISHADCDV